MVSIYTPQKCVQRLDCDYRMFFDLTLSDYQQKHKCEDCSGQIEEGKPCHITLDRLLRLFSLMDEELVDQLEGKLF